MQRLFVLVLEQAGGPGDQRDEGWDARANRRCISRPAPIVFECRICILSATGCKKPTWFVGGNKTVFVYCIVF